MGSDRTAIGFGNTTIRFGDAAIGFGNTTIRFGDTAAGFGNIAGYGAR
jgi:hypothetical protein